MAMWQGMRAGRCGRLAGHVANSASGLRKGWDTAVAKKILVAEDDAPIAEVLAIALTDEGYQVEKALQSLRFYDLVREYKPDLILLDLMMPYLDGQDELRLMQLSPDTSGIPVIVVTAKADAELAREEPILKSLGVRHIVKKPFDVNNVAQLVKQTIG